MNRIYYGALLAAAMMASSGVASAATANPNLLTVKLYKTELYNGSSWVTVMSDAAGVSVDLVNNPGTAFGSGSVDAGTYTMVRFTIQNQVNYGFAAFDTCSANASATFSIDGAQSASAQVGLSFGTNGGIGWRANGTDAFPYLMTQAILVGDGTTTNVKLAFKTAGMVSCATSIASLTPPSFDVISVLKPATAAFTGGDYWIVGLSKNTTNRLYDGSTAIEPEMVTPPGGTQVPLYDYLLNSASTSETLTLSAGSKTFGPYTDAFNTTGVTITVGEYFRAQLRNNSNSELRWGMKASFTPDATDPSIGTVAMLRDTGKHRHQLDESWDTLNNQGFGATAAPTSDAAPMTIGTYTLDANNRFTITASDGNTIKGAFDKNYEVMNAANINRPNGDAELTVGIKVIASGANGPVIPAPTAGNPTTLSWMSYDWEFQRMTSAGATAAGAPWAAKQATMSWDSAHVQYMEFSVNGSSNIDMTGPEFRSAGRMDRPLSLDVCDQTVGGCGTNPFWASMENSNSMSSQLNMAPAAYDTAFTPVGGASDVKAGLLSNMQASDPPWVAYAPTTGTLAIASGTADLDPNWSNANEQRHYLGYAVGMKQAPLGTHTNASVAGTYLATYMWDDVTNGNGQRRVGSGYAELTMDGGSGLSINIHEKASDGTVTNTTMSAGYSVQNICIGLSALAQEAYVESKLIDAGTPPTYPYTFTATEPGTGATVQAANATDIRNIRDGVIHGPARLSPTDSTCSGGKKLQMILGYDPALGSVFATGNPKVVMMIGQTGDVLTFTDPQSFDNAGNYKRQLGLAIKLK